MSVSITSVYAAVLAVFYFALSVRTLRLRRALGIGLGDGGDPRMLRAVRVHSNFAEYVPFVLLLSALLELMTAPAPLIHGLCTALLIGRLSHAYGVSQQAENHAFRVFGMAMTFTAMLVAAVALLALSPAGPLR